MADGSADLLAVFVVRNGWEELLAKAIIRNVSTKDLLAAARIRHPASVMLKGIFIVRQSASTTLKEIITIRHSTELDLDARFYVERTWKELFAKVFIMGASSADLKASVSIRQPSSVSLQAEFIVKQGAADLKGVVEVVPVRDLFASFTVNQSNASATLKAEFLVPMRYEDLPAEFILKQLTSEFHAEFRIRGINDMYSLIGYNMPLLLNHLENIGRGFVGSPYEFVDDGVWAGSRAAKFTSAAGAGQFKEITFGWRREPHFDYPSCLTGRGYEELVSESWDWDEQSYITSVVSDTHIRLQFARHFGNSGWTLGNINYGTVNYLKVSYFDYVYPGDCYDRWKNLEDEESFIRFNIGAPSLDRLGYARFEWFRYHGTDCRQFMSLRRIASCEEVPVTYQYWNPLNKIGGCAYPPLKGNIWSELALKWDNSGRSNLSMGGGQPYMGLAAFVNDSPQIYYGLTAENNEWDMFELTEILEGWANGDFKNNGIGIRGEMTIGGYGGWDYRCSNEFGNTPRFYSRRSTDPRKPRILLQYIPQASVGKWIFQARTETATIPTVKNCWEIENDSALRLRDWSKVNYYAYFQRAGLELNSSKNLIGGKIETWLKLPRDDWPQLVAVNQDECELCQINYTTSKQNSIDFYFRWVDGNNYYKIMLNPRSRASKLYRRYNGVSTQLVSWTSAFNIGDWKKIRIFWGLISDDDLFICGQMWNPYLGRWRPLFSCHDVDPKFDSGGKVRVETWDAMLDDTSISEEV